MINNDVNIPDSAHADRGVKMTGKKRLIIILVAVAVALIGTVTLVIYLNDQSNNTVGTFDMTDYEKYGELNADYVSTADSAKLIAEAVWNSIYGKDSGISRPFKVSYDSAKKIWLVQGSRPGGQTGVLPNILIQQSDGKVLAVWYDK
jgi:hypothetical protein